MFGYLRNDNEQIVITAFNTEEGHLFEPFVNNGTMGFRITEVDEVTREATGRVEYVFLNPSHSHDRPVNDPGSTADTFLYKVEGEDALAFDRDWLAAAQSEEEKPLPTIQDYARPIIYVDHFEGES